MAKRGRSADEKRSGIRDGRTFLTARLEISPEEFGEQQLKFARSLAQTLRIYRSDVDILAYRPGCVDVDMLLPAPAAKELDDAARSGKSRSKELEELFKRWKLSKVTPTGAAFSEATIHFKSPGRALTWLHLSDIHIKAPGEKGAPAEDTVRKKFLEQLPEAMSDFDVVPDAVFVTGDITYSAEPKQFDEAMKMLQGVRTALNKPGIPILAVPGNHDVHRPAITGAAADLESEARARKELADHEAVENLLQDPQNKGWRDSLFKRLANFNAFSQKAWQFGQPQIIGDEFFFKTHLQHLNLKVGIAGLNSAWRSSHEPDRYHLMLSRLQIDAVERALADADLRIALVHHPIPSPEWFAQFDLAYQRTALHCFDFILHGHEHTPGAEAIVPGRKGAYQRVAAGALYTNELGYTNSFNAVRVDLDHGHATVFFWRFGKNAGIWVKDVETFPREGYETFALPYFLKKRLGIKSGMTPTPGSDGPSL